MNEDLKSALLAYADEYIGQGGAMDPDHGSEVAQKLCAALGSGMWHAEINTEADRICDIFYGEEIYQCNLTIRTVEIF